MSRFLFLLPIFILFSLAAAAPGEPYDIPIDNEAARNVQAGVDELNRQQHKMLYQIVKINRAQEQVVAGKNLIYNVGLIGRSICDKQNKGICENRIEVAEYKITRYEPVNDDPVSYEITKIPINQQR